MNEQMNRIQHSAGVAATTLDFNTADLPIMLRTQDLAARYRKHLLEA
jgi:hypothetical protein